MFDKLFSPGKIGSMNLRNRIVFPPMATNFGQNEGFVSDQMIDYYAERAKGAAMIVVEAAYTRPEGYAIRRLRITDDKFIPGLKRLADAIHKEGAKAALQVQARRGRDDAVDPVSASDVPLDKHYRYSGIKPRLLSTADVEALVAEQNSCIHRVREAGFDALFLHGGHGYLICEFLSPLSNLRTDKYGGTLEKRARLALEFLEGSRKALGKDFPIIYRLCLDDHRPGGFGPDQGVAVAKMLEKGGADAIDVVAGMLETYEWTVPPMSVPRGYNVPLAAMVKKAVKIPVLVAGRINNAELAEKVLQEGKADFIDIGRGLIADHEFVQKAQAGHPEEIRKCLACEECMNLTVRAKMNPVPFLICASNPNTGHEREFILQPAAKAKKVLVIGGGPGGMETARIAKLRGHDVTLWEKEDRLGGTMNLAVLPPHKEEIQNLTDYLTLMMKKLKVKVELGKTATFEEVRKFNPDAVVVATGSLPFVPRIKGVDRPNLVIAQDVLTGKAQTGKRAIVIGGGLVGCETAEFLVAKGKKATIVEMLDDVAIETAPHERWFLIPRMQEMGIQMLVKTKAEEITDKGLVVSDANGKRLVEGDTVVMAVGAKPNIALLEQLGASLPEVYSVGDCSRGGRIINATFDGSVVGRQL